MSLLQKLLSIGTYNQQPKQGGTYYQHRFVCNKCGLIFM